jgi:hypothetical protein
LYIQTLKLIAMLKIGHLKSGDLIKVNDNGIEREGVVVKVNHAEHLALVNNGIQEFWYEQEAMDSIPLDESQLMKLGFTKEETDGSVKYKKDSFRLLTPQKGNFSNIEMWWREDKRHFNFPLSVHEFQNLYHDMTKVYLEKA